MGKPRLSEAQELAQVHSDGVRWSWSHYTVPQPGGTIVPGGGATSGPAGLPLQRCCFCRIFLYQSARKPWVPISNRCNTSCVTRAGAAHSSFCLLISGVKTYWVWGGLIYGQTYTVTHCSLWKGRRRCLSLWQPLKRCQVFPKPLAPPRWAGTGAKVLGQVQA